MNAATRRSVHMASPHPRLARASTHQQRANSRVLAAPHPHLATSPPAPPAPGACAHASLSLALPKANSDTANLTRAAHLSRGAPPPPPHCRPCTCRTHAFASSVITFVHSQPFASALQFIRPSSLGGPATSILQARTPHPGHHRVCASCFSGHADGATDSDRDCG
jgi:hypothetical protein